MNFSQALDQLKHNTAVRRIGWNGKGMFIYLVQPGSYPATTDVAKNYWKDKGTGTGVGGVPMVPYGPYIAMKTTQENVVPWLASQTDLLADDWEVANEVSA